MSTKHQKVKRKFLLSMEELKMIDNMMQSDDVESRLLGLSLLETSALGKHYFLKGKIPYYGSISSIVAKLKTVLSTNKISLLESSCNIFYQAWIRAFIIWIRSKTY